MKFTQAIPSTILLLASTIAAKSKPEPSLGNVAAPWANPTAVQVRQPPHGMQQVPYQIPSQQSAPQVMFRDPNTYPEHKVPALKYSERPFEKDGLEPGDVFGLVTLSENKNVDGETVVIYADGTLGIKEPRAPGYLFQAVLFPEYDLLTVPEPFATVKLNDHNVYFVNDSLFNPATIFSAQGWSLKTKDGSTVVCPSWNSVLTYVGTEEKPPCQDAVHVDLGIVPISAE